MFGKKFKAAVIGLVSSVLFVGSASAHMFILKPDKMSAPAGTELKVEATLSEPLFKSDIADTMLAGKGWTIKFDASVITAKSKEAVDVKGFKPNDSDPAKATASVGSIKLSAKGTTVLSGVFDMLNKEGKRTRCFAKTFVNLTNDGMTTKQLGDNSVAEIILLDNVKGMKSGDSVKVKVLLKGKPLADAEVSATYDGAPSKAADNPENEYITVKTDSKGEASFKLDRASLWGFTLEYTDSSDSVRYRTSSLFAVK